MVCSINRIADSQTSLSEFISSRFIRYFLSGDLYGQFERGLTVCRYLTTYPIQDRVESCQDTCCQQGFAGSVKLIDYESNPLFPPIAFPSLNNSLVQEFVGTCRVWPWTSCLAMGASR